MSVRSPVGRAARVVAREALGALRRLRPAATGHARVIYYHRIDDEQHRSCVTPAAFADQMRLLREEGWNVVPFPSLATSLAAGEAFPERTVAVTFDDGFADNHRNAFPVLDRWSIPATIFLATGFIGGAELPVLRDRSGIPPLDWGQVEEMARHGIDFGGHTVTHRSLTALDDADLAREVRDCRAPIERRTGRSSNAFCYPRGHLDARVEAAVRDAGWTIAATTEPGDVPPGAPRLRLRRTFIARDDSPRDFAHKLAGTYDLLHRARGLGRAAAPTGAG